jgi:hypothetical protein
MATKQKIDCPLCKGETIQPYETMYDHHGQSIGLRSEVKWRLEGTTLYQSVNAEYITDKDLYYDEDFTPEVNYCIPVYGLSHCPYCRRRLVKSLRDNGMKTKSAKVSYSMLCSPRLDGDGNELAIKLKEGLTKVLAELVTLKKVSSGETVKLV